MDSNPSNVDCEKKMTSLVESDISDAKFLYEFKDGRSIAVLIPKNTPQHQCKINNVERKKRVEFEQKKKVAIAVSKFPNIYDHQHKDYSNKTMEIATWTKIAAETELDGATCIRHWKSLKGLAKYYCIYSGPQFVYKSGSTGNDVATETKYKSQWLYKDLMSFYTPPTQQVKSNRIFISNITDILESTSDTSNQRSGQSSNQLENMSTTSVPIGLNTNLKSYESPLKYYSTWAYLDTLASQLNEEVVEELYRKFLKLIDHALKTESGSKNNLEKSDEHRTDFALKIEGDICEVKETDLNDEFIDNELDDDLMENVPNPNDNLEETEIDQADNRKECNKNKQPTEEIIQVNNPKWDKTKFGRCTICGVIRSNIKRHMDIHKKSRSDNSLVGMPCDDNITDMIIQSRNPKWDKRKYGKCSICGVVRAYIKRHMKIHKNEITNASINIPTNSELKINSSNIIKIDKVNRKPPIEIKTAGTCPICDCTSTNINKHIRTRHGNKENKIDGKTEKKDDQTRLNVIKNFEENTLCQNNNQDDTASLLNKFEEYQPIEKNIEMNELIRLKNECRKCSVCDRETNNIHQHIEGHINQKMQNISDANKNATLDELLRIKERYEKCPICNRRTINIDKHLLYHIRRKKMYDKEQDLVTNEKMCCICGKWMTTNLILHMTQSHKNDKCRLLNEIKADVEEGKMFPVSGACQLCDKTYDNILQHTQTMHLEPLVKYGGPSEVCYICGAKVRYLKNHMFIHTSGSVTCDLCKKTFTNKRGLEWHMKIHLNIRNYKCNLCRAAFVTYSAWKSHTYGHYGIKNHKCNLCDKRFKLKYQLTIHERKIHMGGIHVQCSFCEKVFTDTKCRRRHEKLHTNHKREYPCKFCPKILGSESGCYLHMRTHGRENPYACNICNVKFTQFGDYNSHMRQHKYNQI